MKRFKTKKGADAAHARDGEWLQPTINPFGHGCCDCGLFHQVEVRVVDKKGKVIDGAEIQMKWSVDLEETLRLREHRKSQKA